MQCGKRCLDAARGREGHKTAAGTLRAHTAGTELRNVRTARILVKPLCATTGTTGVKTPASALSLSRKIGQGSFGQVFEVGDQ